MKRFLFAVFALFSLAASALAQTVVQERVGVGKPLVGAVDVPPDVAGATMKLQFYIDNTLQPNVVFGAPSGTTRSVQFAIPAFSTPGVRSLRISSVYTISDTSKWVCPDGDAGTQTAVGLVCREIFATNSIALTVDPPPQPIPTPAPTNFRIILTPVVGGNGDVIGVDVQVIADDGRVLKEFAPVANRRTGAFLNSLYLAAATSFEMK